MRSLTLLLSLLSFGLPLQAQTPAEAAITRVLDSFHEAASQHDFQRYFEQTSPDLVFLGTDAKERWDRKAFEQYVKPFFDKGQGWTYKAQERHIQIAQDQKLAWFDELLDNPKYGTCRGTGVLQKIGKDWKISQDHLTIPVPNELAATLVQMIQDAKTKTAKP